MIKKINFKKNYCIFAISFVYFFLEITLFRIVKPIGLQQYWVIIPTLIYIVSKKIEPPPTLEIQGLKAVSINTFCPIGLKKPYQFSVVISENQ